jgi:hypothetical protein
MSPDYVQKALPPLLLPTAALEAGVTHRQGGPSLRLDCKAMVVCLESLAKCGWRRYHARRIRGLNQGPIAYRSCVKIHMGSRQSSRRSRSVGCRRVGEMCVARVVAEGACAVACPNSGGNASKKQTQRPKRVTDPKSPIEYPSS